MFRGTTSSDHVDIVGNHLLIEDILRVVSFTERDSVVREPAAAATASDSATPEHEPGSIVHQQNVARGRRTGFRAVKLTSKVESCLVPISEDVGKRLDALAAADRH
jgi:hypothetical protein